jgi:amino acid transporter
VSVSKTRNPATGKARRSVRAAGSGAGPSAGMPPLADVDLEVLRQVGGHWRRAVGDDEGPRALPVDPALGRYPAEVRPGRFGRFVEIVHDGEPRPARAEEAPARPDAFGRVTGAMQRVVLGPPLKSTAIARERMRRLVALPVLSADALSSVAYGPEAMLAVLVLGGSAALSLSLPIAAAIACLMLAVGVSYRQTIRAYPGGGGSYIVATDNLGRVAGLAAAAGLMLDYVLTVAVSVAAGVAAITSAVPAVAADAVPVGLAAIALLLVGNLRGVRQAGFLFAVPTYAFIVAIGGVVAVGLGQAAVHGFQPTSAPGVSATQGIGLLLVLRAFASGATAMTGIEAISNAVPVFRPPGWRNARSTLTWMIAILIALFAGTIAVIHFEGVVPHPDETVLSQLAHHSFGTGLLYACTQAATAAVLLLAANTAFNDFPRLLFLMARDFQAPRIFLRMGDRLAFSNGIIALSVASAAMFVAFHGRTNRLIPLYAVGVFLAFALSQAGMVARWWRRRESHWRKSLLFNATGAVLSALVLVIAGITKFSHGGWVAVVAVPLIVLAGIRIRRHFDAVHAALRLDPLASEVPARAVASIVAERAAPPGVARAPEEGEESPEEIRHLTIVPVASLDRAAMRALAYAVSLHQPVLALHISPGEDEAQRFRSYWREWGDHLPLEIVVSDYRATVAPMIHYIETLHHQRPDLTLTVILPELVVPHWWQRLLHHRIAPRLKRALESLPKVVVTTVPFHLPR